MESMNEHEGMLQSPKLHNEAKAHLKGAALWAQLLAIFGFVCATLVLVGLLFAVFSQGSQLPFMLIIGYGLALVLYFFLSYYLYTFAQKTREAFRTNNDRALTEAFKSLKGLFRLMGILVLVGIVFNILIFFFGGAILGLI